MQFSKLRTGEGSTLDIKTYGFDFFESTINILLQYKKYTRKDILEFMKNLCYTKEKSFYLNQNNISASIRRKIIYDDNFIKTKVVVDKKTGAKDLEMKYYDNEDNEVRV